MMRLTPELERQFTSLAMRDNHMNPADKIIALDEARRIKKGEKHDKHILILCSLVAAFVLGMLVSGWRTSASLQKIETPQGNVSCHTTGEISCREIAKILSGRIVK